MWYSIKSEMQKLKTLEFLDFLKSQNLWNSIKLYNALRLHKVCLFEVRLWSYHLIKTLCQGFHNSEILIIGPLNHEVNFWNHRILDSKNSFYESFYDDIEVAF